MDTKISKQKEIEIEQCLAEYSISKKHDAFRYLKMVVAYSYLNSGIKLKDIYQEIGKNEKLHPDTVHMSISRLVKQSAPMEDGQRLTIKKLVNICVNTIHSLSEDA